MLAVVTAHARDDWESQRLLAALARLTPVCVVAPAALGAWVVEAKARVHVGGQPADRFDGFVVLRGLSFGGDAELQVELLRALPLSGVPVFNRVEGIVAASDRFRAAVTLSLAGVPTPRAAVVQTLDEARQALVELGPSWLLPRIGAVAGDPVEVGLGQGEESAVGQALFEAGSVFLRRQVPERLRLRCWSVFGQVVAMLPLGGTTDGLFASTSAQRALGRLASRAAGALGLSVAAVDVAVGASSAWVLEVDPAPGWRCLSEAVGIDLAQPIAQGLVARCLARAGRVAEPTPEPAFESEQAAGA
ncbi:MAG: ATP-grasp domain-containing protein [Deltaproteobacteria bacterium]